MFKELLYNLEFNDGYDYPSWTSFPDDFWEIILSNFFYKHADSFGFINVLDNKDLIPLGLDYFKNWVLEYIGMVEFNNNIAARFLLNDDCKSRLLLKDFSKHWISDKYYEYDELYFFKDDRLIGSFIYQEDIILFNNFSDYDLSDFDKLDFNV
jgi:hypothetical protein